MSNIIHGHPLSSSSSCSLPAAVLSEITSSTNNATAPCSSSSKLPDWEADSNSSESKSSCSGGGQGRWRPRREVLNIDSIFTRERRRQAGYSPLGAEGGAPDASFTAPLSSSWTLPTTSSSHKGGAAGGAEPPPPRLIQRMESGYESSERNSSSPVSLDLNPRDQ